MPIPKEQIQATADMAKLDLTDKEGAILAGQLHDLLEYAEVLAGMELKMVQPLTQTENGYFEPWIQHSPSLAQGEVLALAPDVVRGMIRVPRVMDDE